MRTPMIPRRRKLPGGKNCELTKLKLRWRTLSDEARAYWREKFVADLSHAAVRALISERLQIHLRYDQQMSKFRAWELDERERELEAERQAEDERQALAENPNWTLDQARERVLTKAYQRALAKGDFALGLATVKQDLNAQKVGLDERKLDLLEKKAAQADSAKEVVASKMTPEQKEAEYRRIFGME
jgi:hypothetical protein